MSVDQYQRAVNSLDKEIADLEKKKAASDQKAANEARKAGNVSISKNASASIISSKRRQIEGYLASQHRAESESAALQKRIADKRAKRNEAYLKLQKEQAREREKEKKSIEHETYTEQPIEGELSECDVFISHAWEDKASFVDEFVQLLEDRNLHVWYDKSKIKWGDSMRAKIDEGLRHSKFGIVVLSPDYIAEGKYWTKTELDSLFQLESINGKMILPIWHNLTKKQVMDFSPSIAGRLAMNTASMTPEEIADKLQELLQDIAEE